MKVSVVVPTLLADLPRLRRALSSVGNQHSVDEIEIEMLVATDPISEQLTQVVDDVFAFRHVQGTGGQWSAVNAGVHAATGDVVAILEDDDRWHPLKLATQLRIWNDNRDALITSNQIAVDETDEPITINDFPTPSGWLFSKSVFSTVGGFDESFRYHADLKFLNCAVAAGVPRFHLVEAGSLKQTWRKLDRFKGRSLVVETDLATPTVARFLNPRGAMARIQKSTEETDRSSREQRWIWQQFKGAGW
jgi:glycosyltransferase involved in cell wall biosynthesis